MTLLEKKNTTFGLIEKHIRDRRKNKRLSKTHLNGSKLPPRTQRHQNNAAQTCATVSHFIEIIFYALHLEQFFFVKTGTCIARFYSAGIILVP